MLGIGGSPCSSNSSSSVSTLEPRLEDVEYEDFRDFTDAFDSLRLDMSYPVPIALTLWILSVAFRTLSLKSLSSSVSTLSMDVLSVVVVVVVVEAVALSIVLMLRTVVNDLDGSLSRLTLQLVLEVGWFFQLRHCTLSGLIAF